MLSWRSGRGAHSPECAATCWLGADPLHRTSLFWMRYPPQALRFRPEGSKFQGQIVSAERPWGLECKRNLSHYFCCLPGVFLLRIVDWI